ncbi:hypothetical protein C8A03DRAFT_19390 [Achaetomium macrosporum]|uniref:Cytochrome b5 heme-binding domain-containing protein n=1 Tax=Achaetomium macrosporum TaxID=79813 RepID=A0AAN7C1E5_9PEZI|nr:hypothetical protein C8A03DRAFT_19390 [Achaetomium macrosporum]
MNVQPAANLPQRPPSPWLRKFGSLDQAVIHSVPSANRHSGLAPIFPELHPTYYADEVPLNPIPRPTDHELDVLFGTERAQIESNLGLATWEIGILREYLINGWPGGHRSNDPPMSHILEHGYGVDVEEDTWHPVFARGKWYDFRVPILDRRFLPDGVEGITPEDIWSVDVPRVWKELRVSIELANRWLRHMAKGLWLNHLVHEEREEWMEAIPRPGFVPPDGVEDAGNNQPREKFDASLGPNEKPWRIPARGRLTDYDSDVTLMEIANRLRSKHIWTFVDDGHHLQDGSDHQELFGRTHRQWNRGEEPDKGTEHEERPPTFLTTYIHVQPLRVLLNPASTLSERCHSTWCLAMTHAINFAGHDTWRDPGFEPYYGNEWSSELGQSAIKSFFGGDISEAPVLETPGKPGYKYGLATVDFPEPPGVENVLAINNVPVVHLGQVTHSYPLPTAWISSTLLQSFYESIAQRYGLAAFQAPKLFSSRKVWRGFYTRVHRAQPLPAPPSIITLSAAADPGLYQPLRDTHNALLARRRVYDRIRPWYSYEYLRWQLTPYADVACRAIIKRFSTAVHPSVRVPDPHRAERDGHQAISTMHIWLDQHPLRPGLDQAWPRTMWFYAVLSYMMQAVLPGREKTVGRDYRFREAKNVWFPSQACVQSGNDRWEFPETRHVYEKLSRHYDMKQRHTEQRPGGVSNRVWLLEQARNIMRAQMPVEPLPAPLADALEVELQRLLQQATFEVIDFTDWLDWEFDFPPYSTEFVNAHEDEQGVFLVPWQGFPGGWPEPGDEQFEISPRPPPMQAMSARVVDEGGYDVFDLSDVLNDDPTVDLGTVLEQTQLGRMIVFREIMDAIRAQGQRPLGKLLTWRHLQEVHEHDGQDGRALWCVIGQFIYDITERRFTRAELKRHIYPEIGMYCEIDGGVYDLGRYLHSHPGGAEFLRQSAGTDATEAFQKAHDDWKRTLHTYSALCIGRIVEERSSSQRIDDDEIILFDEVFRTSELITDHEALYHDLQRFGGTDATHALQASDAPDALHQLLSKKHLVSAKLVPRRRITHAELQENKRLPDKSERRKRPRADDTNWRAWVSVEGTPRTLTPEGTRSVYDVTIPMMFGGAELKEKLRPWLGKQVEDEDLALLLQTDYDGFIIGEIVGDGSGVEIGE